MKDNFQFRRFFTYFKYDLVQMWRNHGRTLMVFAGLGLLSYLVFEQSWDAQALSFRVVMFIVAFSLVELFQARFYGHLTERKAGSAWLMIPASRAEKFVSMLLMVNIVIPVAFLAVYLALDGILSLLDPTFGQSIAAAAGDLVAKARGGMDTMFTESPVTISAAGIIGILLLSNCVNFTYFLLCGLCFKKNKIGGALLVIFLISVVLSILGTLAIIPNGEFLVDLEEADAIRVATGFLNGMVVFSCLLFAGLAWGVWYRLKTLQH